MEILVATIFPRLFEAFCEEGIAGRAVDRGQLSIEAVNLRDFSGDKRHRKVDDYLYGGGPGLLFTPEAPAALVKKHKRSAKDRVVLLAPAGRRVDTALVREYTQYTRLILFCGRYEGYDERFVSRYCDDVVSVGDFVCMGGETPAMMFIEAIARRLEGVLGKQGSYEQDSFEDGLLEGGHYTRPVTFEGMEVPAVLQSGNHRAIARKRRFDSLKVTLLRRPELLEAAVLTEEDRIDLKTIYKELYCGYHI